MPPDLVDIPASRDIAGLAARTSNARESDPTTAALPALWARFAAAQRSSATPAPVYGVYTDYASDADGAYTTVVGHEAGSGTAAATAERVVRVPAGRYAVFTSTGEMPAAVIAGWQAVWRYFANATAPTRAYGADFEYYDPAQPSVVRIFVGVRDTTPAARA